MIGAGGIGGYFGGRLAAGGHDVTFVARGDHLATLRRDGLRVESIHGDFSVTPTQATDDPAAVGPVDAVLVAVKTSQLDPVLDSLPLLVGPDTVVVSTQNGVEAPGRLAGVVGSGAVLPGVARIFAMVDRPGVVVHRGGPATLSFGEWEGPPSPRAERLRDALVDSGVEASVTADAWTDLWAKMVFVVPLGSLGAALDATVGQLRATPGPRDLLADAMAEVAAVAAARGVSLPADVVERTLGFVDRQDGGATSSLQRDVLAGRPSELDAWTGAVVRLAAEAGVPAPVHRTLLAVLTARHPDALA